MRRQKTMASSSSSHSSSSSTLGKRRIPVRLPAMILLSCLLILSSFLFLRFSYKGSSSSDPMKLRISTFRANVQDFNDDLFMNGLLAHREQDDTCHSRIQHHFYRNSFGFKPSDYLISRLRQYERLHQQCAHRAQTFQEDPADVGECQFVVWVSYSGLGNKLVTLAATFLYALLTNRVLLVDRGKDMKELFCEPFPGASWLLPPDFPKDLLLALDESHPYRFGNLFDANNCIPDAAHLINSSHKALYIHLTHTYNVQDRRFFCEGEQKFLTQVPWLFLKSNNYFVPSLFLMPTFGAEIGKLFPDLETVFHHLGRYLIHPSNSVWDMSVRFYESYLAAEAQVLVGLQLRTFDASDETLKLFSDQVLECVIANGLLPNVTSSSSSSSGSLIKSWAHKSTISVLVTSLHQIYYEKLRDLYVSFPTQDESRRVKVHLPSHEGVQKTDSAEHDKKALMEITLLSFCDALVTSPMSTFGYAAQGLAGVKPMVLRRLEEDEEGQPACSTVASLDPCFHAPPLYDCDCAGGRDPGKILEAVKHCRDVRWGIQLAN